MTFGTHQSTCLPFFAALGKRRALGIFLRCDFASCSWGYKGACPPVSGVSALRLTIVLRSRRSGTSRLLFFMSF